MPIGKNSIKRVVNAGYSKVSTSAPDMENSHIEEEKKALPKKAAAKETEVKKAPAKKPCAPAKSTAKKPAAKKSAEKKPTPIEDLSPKGRLEAVVDAVAPEAKESSSESYTNIGREMPAYLL